MAALTKEQKLDFINRIGPVIQAYAMANGYRVASPIIAQACLESRYGDSALAKKWNNFFGMKCGSAWKGRYVNLRTMEEYSKGTLTAIRDNFRAYDSMEEGVKGYFDFISSKRYAALKDAATPREYLERIKAAGYATSSTYVSSNLNVISLHGLTRYDKFSVISNGQIANESAKNGNPYPEPLRIIRFNTKGNAARWLQYELNRHGAKLAVDGIAGNKTIEALKNFQSQRGLRVDGICGDKTKSELRIA